jgi:hypothetical protein
VEKLRSKGSGRVAICSIFRGKCYDAIISVSFLALLAWHFLCDRNTPFSRLTVSLPSDGRRAAFRALRVGGGGDGDMGGKGGGSKAILVSEH